MVHPDTELRLVNETIGHGVFATRLIPAGTITWVRDDFDQSFSEAEVSTLAPHYQRILDKYAFTDARGLLVLCWDHSRFFNHSCDANCLGAGYDFEIAIRDIQPGEELTDDYGTLNLREPFRCLCAARACRGRIEPDDMERLAGDWDVRVRRVFPLIGRVPQPLWEMLRERAEVEQALQNADAVRSIRHNYAPVCQPARNGHGTHGKLALAEPALA